MRSPRRSAAFVDEFVARLPEGYDTHRRRARHAPVGRPAPAHRDRPRHAQGRAAAAARRSHQQRSTPKASALVQARARARRCASRTTIVIAHRLATVHRRRPHPRARTAAGIVDVGHATTALVARGGLYARLAAMQFSA
jgi:ATP-binding cassette subfamily B protein